MSHETLNMTIYSPENKFPPEKKEIKGLILDTLSSAPEITTTLDSNDIDVIKSKLNTIQLRSAKPEQVKKYFDDDLVSNGAKRINFEFEILNNSDSITFSLYPTYGSEIDSEYLKQDTRLNDFNILGALTLYNGTYGSLDARFFELAGNIITNYILENGYTNNLIGFQGYEDEQNIMTPNEFLDKIKDFEKHYCNNPNFEE